MTHVFIITERDDFAQSVGRYLRFKEGIIVESIFPPALPKDPAPGAGEEGGAAHVSKLQWVPQTFRKLASWLESRVGRASGEGSLFNAIALMDVPSLVSLDELDPIDRVRDWTSVVGMLLLAFPEVHWAILSPYRPPDPLLKEAHFPQTVSFFDDLDAGRSDDEVLKAVVHTVRAFGIDPDCFRRFLRSMTMDLTVSTYATWDDLLVYMDGSAAVIGEMMLPILEPLSPGALGPARDLGNAFQLTNFLRDVAEDLDRGRVYLPQADLARFGADPARREASPEWVALMDFEIARCRDLYRSSDAGLALLPPTSARCVGAARVLYARILDRIEAQGGDVFSERARVPTWQKAVTVVGALRRG